MNDWDPNIATQESDRVVRYGGSRSAAESGAGEGSANPLKSYKSFVKKDLTAALASIGYYSISEPYKLDVNKTTSLVSPHVGSATVTAKKKLGDDKNVEMEFEITSTHGLRGGVWQLINSKTKVLGGRSLGGDHATNNQVIRKMTGRTFD